MELQARDPNYDERTYASFDRQGFMHHLGARIVELQPGHVVVEVKFGEPLSQQHGYFHGGVVAALADVASGYAAFSLLEPDASNVTVEFKLNLLAPAEGERLVAHRLPEQCVFGDRGRRETLCDSLGHVYGIAG